MTISYKERLAAKKLADAKKQQKAESTVKEPTVKDIDKEKDMTDEVNANDTNNANDNANDDDENMIDSNVDSTPKSPQEAIYDIVGKEALDRMAEAGIIPVPSSQLNGLVEAHSQMTTQMGQLNQQLQLAKDKIGSQSEKLKNQKPLIRRFYQLEAATIGAKEALEAMLKCFDNTGQGLQGWPTMQVFTPDGWVKGSVDYHLHNAVLLAKTATTSENLQVIEKHVRGFTDQIRSLQSDVNDLQSMTPFKIDRCGHCSKYKKVNSKCWNCGKDPSEMEFLDEDDDD